jgi:8-oxo-dGTP pyrophosphatase MutT (NUDIX family)
MVESRKTRSVRRVQYAALPYRRKGKSPTEVLLVTSHETGRWIIPKGWPAKGKPLHKSAAREAREEAGVVGSVERRPLGVFSYQKASEKREGCRLGGPSLRLEGEATGSSLAGEGRAQT